MRMLFKPAFGTWLVAAMLAVLAGCAETPGPSSYTPGEAMTPGQVTSATVLDVRPVTIRANAKTGSIGSLAGAVVGGVAGNAAGEGHGRALMTIGGVILGSILGSQAENVGSTQKAMQVILKTDDGRTLSIVQPEGVNLYKGEAVYLLRYSSDQGERYRVEPQNSQQ